MAIAPQLDGYAFEDIDEGTTAVIGTVVIEGEAVLLVPSRDLSPASR